MTYVILQGLTITRQHANIRECG